jgi:hypothetical protein
LRLNPYMPRHRFDRRRFLRRRFLRSGARPAARATFSFTMPPRGGLGACFGLLLAAALLVGCGHPATEQECEEIFARSAAIELKDQNVVDPAEIKRRTDAAREARGKELLAKCVGKRITDDAMACVRKAETAEALEACLSW